MIGYDRYRYNPFTDSFVEETEIDRLTESSDFTTVRVSDIENIRAELKKYKKALELMAARLAGCDGADLCELEECIKTIVDYYLIEANDD